MKITTLVEVCSSDEVPTVVPVAASLCTIGSMTPAQVMKLLSRLPLLEGLVLTPPSNRPAVEVVDCEVKFNYTNTMQFEAEVESYDDCLVFTAFEEEVVSI